MTDHDERRPRHAVRPRRPEPSEQPDEPVDLNDFAAVQSTDALLDRLGRRLTADDDLADPLAALLAELTRDVDLETDASRRFRAVLAGRTAQDGQWRLEPPSTGPIPMIPARAAAHRREDRRGGGTLLELARLLPAMGVAAAVVTLVAGGVVAAVTGDPMAPITAVNGALGEPQTVSYQQVQESIRSARQAVRTGDSRRARNLIDRAKDDLDKVAAPQQPALDQQITDVEQSLTASPTVASPSTDPTARPGLGTPPVSTPGGTATGSGTSTASATATGTPSATATVTVTVTAPATSPPTPTTAASSSPPP